MTIPVEYPAVEIAPAPIKAPAVDRAAAAARVTAARALAADLNKHAKSRPGVAEIAAGVEYGLNNRATALADLLRAGAYDEQLALALDRLTEAEDSARDCMQRTSYVDMEAKALSSPPETIRPPINYEPL